MTTKISPLFPLSTGYWLLDLIKDREEEATRRHSLARTTSRTLKQTGPWVGPKPRLDMTQQQQ